MKLILTRLIRLYQIVISPYFPASCRFAPSCSQYALDAIQVHGTLKGGLLALKRIVRCHPWSEGGDDPVPPVDKKLPSSFKEPGDKKI